jgi:hypothetical protein
MSTSAAREFGPVGACALTARIGLDGDQSGCSFRVAFVRAASGAVHQIVAERNISENEEEN